MKPPLVEVVWTDARSIIDCLRLSTARGASLIIRHSVGYLITQDTERVVIAGTFDPHDAHEDEDGVADVTVIPAGWVASITMLGVPRTPRAPRTKRRQSEPEADISCQLVEVA